MIYGPGEFQPNAMKSMEEYIEQASRTKQSLYNKVRISTRHALLALSKGERIYTVESVEALIGFHLVYYTLGEGNILHRGTPHRSLKQIPFNKMDWQAFNDVPWFIEHHAYHESDLELINEKPVPFEEKNQEPKERPQELELGIDYILIPDDRGNMIDVYPGSIVHIPTHNFGRTGGNDAVVSEIIDKDTIRAYVRDYNGFYDRKVMTKLNINRNNVLDKWSWKGHPEKFGEEVEGVDFFSLQMNNVHRGQRVRIKEINSQHHTSVELSKYEIPSQIAVIADFVDREYLLLTVEVVDRYNRFTKNIDTILHKERILEIVSIKLDNPEEEA